MSRWKANWDGRIERAISQEDAARAQSILREELRAFDGVGTIKREGHGIRFAAAVFYVEAETDDDALGKAANAIFAAFEEAGLAWPAFKTDRWIIGPAD
jgi:hypothetical protein